MKNLAKKTTLSVAALSMALNNMPTVHANVVGEELNEETLTETAANFQEQVKEIVEQNVSKEEAQAAYDKIMSSSQDVIGKIDDVTANVSDIETKLQETLEGAQAKYAAESTLEEIKNKLEDTDLESLPEFSEDGIKDFINGKIDEELENLDISDIINGGKDAIDSITDIAGKVEDAKENFETSVEDFKNDMLDSKNELEGSIKDAYDSVLEDVNGVIGEAHEGAMDSIEDLENALGNATDAMINGSEAIEDKVEDILGDINETTEDIKNMDDNGVADGANKLEEEVNANKEASEEAVEETNKAIEEIIASLGNVDSTEENAAKVEAEKNQAAAEEAAKKAAELEAEANKLIEESTSNGTLAYDAELVEQLKALQAQANDEAAKAQQAVASANALVLNSQAEVNTIAKKAAEAQAKVDALVAALEGRVTVTDKSGDLLELQAELQAAKEELNGYKSEMAQAEADLEAAKVLALAAKTTAETANKALNATQEKLEEADAIVDKLADAAIAKLEAEAAQATTDYNNAVIEAAEAKKAYDEAYAAWLEAGDAAITEAELLALSAAAKVSADLAVRYYDLMVEKQNELITENENAIQNNKDAIADKDAEFEEEKEAIKAEMEQVLADKEAAKSEIEDLKQQTKEDEAFNKGKQDQIDANNTTIGGLEDANTELTDKNTELAKKNEELQAAIDAADELASDAKDYVEANKADKEAHEKFMNGDNLMNSVVKTDEEGKTTVEHDSLLNSTDTTTYTAEENLKFDLTGLAGIKPTDATTVTTTKVVEIYEYRQTGTKTETIVIKEDVKSPISGKVLYTINVEKEINVPVYEYVLIETKPAETVTLVGNETAKLGNTIVEDGEFNREISLTVTQVKYGNATSYTDYVSNDMIHQSYVDLANQLNDEAPTFSYVDANGVTVTTKYTIDTEGKTTAELEQAIIEYKNNVAAYGSIYGENSIITYWENYAANQGSIVTGKQNAIIANNGTIATNNQTIANNQATINGLNDANATLESEKIAVRDNSEAISELETLIDELDAKYSEIKIPVIDLTIGSGSLKDELDNVGSDDEEYNNLQEEQKELNKEWLTLKAELLALNGLHAGAEELSEEADAAFQAKIEDAKAAAEVLLNATGTLTQEAMEAALAELRMAIAEAKAIIAEDVKDVVVDVKGNYDAQYEYVNNVVTDAAAKADEASKIANAALQLVSKGENAALDSVQLMNVVDMALANAQAEYDAAYASYQALLNTTYEVDPEVMAQLAEQIAKLSEIEKSLEEAKEAANNAALEASGKAHQSAQNIQDKLCKDGTGLACKLNVTLKGSESYNEEEANTTGLSSDSVEGSNLNALISHIQHKYANDEIFATLGEANEGMMWSIQWNVAFLEENGTWTVEYEYVQVNDPDYVPNVSLDGELPTPEVNYDEPAQPGEGPNPLPTPGVDYEEPTVTPSRPSTGGGSGGGSSRPSTPAVEEEEEIIEIEDEEIAQGEAVTNPVIAAVADQPLRTFLNALVQKEEIKQYSTFGLKTFDNSRVTGIKATSKGFTITGYMWIDGVSPTKDTWREIVLVNTEDMSTEFAYRKQTSAVDSSWLNNNKIATQDGKLDLTYAGYSLDVNYDDLNSYTDNKSGAKIKAGTYQMFMRISDGKDSFLFPLVDRVLSDGSTMESTNSLPQGFAVMADEVRSLTVTIK